MVGDVQLCMGFRALNNNDNIMVEGKTKVNKHHFYSFIILVKKMMEIKIIHTKFRL